MGEGDVADMKLFVKTLKGTNFEIEASPEASVRSLPPSPLSFSLPQSARFRGNSPGIRSIRGAFGCDFGIGFGSGGSGALRGCGFDLNLGFRVE